MRLGDLDRIAQDVIENYDKQDLLWTSHLMGCRLKRNRLRE
nr:MAG TPA: hypothetical protein [Bacteriophage sp.]